MDPDTDPTPDPTPFFSDFKDAKKLIFFRLFFFYSLPTGTLSSVLKIKFLLEFCVKILFCKHYFIIILTSDPWIRFRILEAQKNAEPVDPNSLHCLQHHMFS